ncbi:MAG: hypothetical protein ACAI37_01060 [Chthoniobacter sp.]
MTDGAVGYATPQSADGLPRILRDASRGWQNAGFPKERPGGGTFKSTQLMQWPYDFAAD